MDMSTTPQTILVTGAAGYLASWIVEQLLRQGHTVHGTVRSLTDATKVAHLRDLAATLAGRLSLFEADLLRDGSFDQAMHGCDVVIHTASPYFLNRPKDPQTELVRPAVQGTVNVLDAVNRSASVRRVVLTSSIATLYNDAVDMRDVPSHMVRESDTNPNTDPQHNTYAYSKTAAEQAAWDMHKRQARWDMVSIHPGAIFGPSLSKRVDATSVEMTTQFLNGSFQTGVPRLWLGVVDVRDAAQAHVRAALLPGAHGRYIAVAESARLLDMAAMMRVADVGLNDKLPRREAPKALLWLIAPLIGLQRSYIARNVGFPVFFDHGRSQAELGIQYRRIDSTLNDHIRQVVADGLVA
jgi:nucleoside-diphosphate-sugar epimerase